MTSILAAATTANLRDVCDRERVWRIWRISCSLLRCRKCTPSGHFTTGRLHVALRGEDIPRPPLGLVRDEQGRARAKMLRTDANCGAWQWTAVVLATLLGVRLASK